MNGNKEDNGMREEFIDSMDELLESVNGEGQIKECNFDWDKMEVSFVFTLQKPEGEWTWLGY